MARAISLNLRLRWPDANDDYLVYFEGHSVGNLRLVESGWEWAISIPMGLPEWAKGRTESRDESVKAFATAWARLLSQTNPDRLQRAFEFAKAAESRLPLK